jgi:hypothetical protein
MSGWGQALIEKKKKDVEFAMRVRRIRRTWYHFTEDTAAKIAGFVCLLMALGVCAGVWYAMNMAMGLFR